MDRPLAQAPDSVKLCLKTHSEEATEKDMQTATPCLNINYVGEHTCMHTHVHKHIQIHMFTYRHACVRVRTHAQAHAESEHTCPYLVCLIKHSPYASSAEPNIATQHT